VDVHSLLVAPEDRTYEVILRLRVLATERQVGTGRPDSVEFVAELSYGGLFDFTSISPDETDEVLLIECPQILYPFACAILADLSRDANFAPLALGPMDFAELWRERQTQTRREDQS